jgi:PKD repeat protein
MALVALVVLGLSAVTVTQPGGRASAEETLTFSPVADANIVKPAPTRNYGSAGTVAVDTRPLYQFLLKFTVTGVGGQHVLSARLRLFNVGDSVRGGDFHRVADQGWSESTVTWNTAPAADATPIASLGAVRAGQWYEVDVTSLVTGDGSYSIRVTAPSDDGAIYNSKEASTNRPELVVVTDGSAGSPASLIANAGSDQLTTPGVPVSFAGSASGGSPPHDFAWDFGDGTGGSGAEPTHAYGAAGTYTARLTVTDAAGATVSDTATVTVQPTSVPPAEGTVVFGAGGDHGQNATTEASLNALANAGTNFYLALGDLSYTDVGRESSWCDLVTSRLGATYPFQLVAGNHDSDEDPDGHITTFGRCLPDRLNSQGTYGVQYFFDWGGLVRAIMISPDLVIGGVTYDYTIGSASHAWLSAAIDGARAAGIPWVVVGMHKNCITIGHKSCEIGPDLMSLLLDKKVDLILQGHDHTYQRSKQLACATARSFSSSCVVDDGADGVYTRGAGSILVIVGTFGVPHNPVSTTDAEAGYFARWMGANTDPTWGFLRMTASSTHLTGEFVRSAGGSFTDTFTIAGR